MSFTGHIPPGGEGTVRIRMETKGYAGQLVSKGAKVYTNDPLNGVFELTMEGLVEPFITITPQRVVLNGRAGDAIEQKVIISVPEKYTIAIVKGLAQYGKDISFTYSGTGDPCCREYLLRVTNTRTRPGRYADTIVLETNSKLRDVISVPVIGIIK